MKKRRAKPQSIAQGRSFCTLIAGKASAFFCDQSLGHGKRSAYIKRKAGKAERFAPDGISKKEKCASQKIHNFFEKTIAKRQIICYNIVLKNFSKGSNCNGLSGNNIARSSRSHYQKG